MKKASLSLLIAASLFSAIPAHAGGISFDLPRLDFPAPQPDASRDCASLATVTATCAPTKS
ncbi:MAG TPA: hypothetical protein PLI43_01385 [Albidovulum sp.]|uniref:hypothetical protein n=1 Tax=Albidovulum sp. TaxID=1872424 RepID=UPI002BE9FD7E|nr:hypothetical protein [Albidovulum sp.]